MNCPLINTQYEPCCLIKFRENIDYARCEYSSLCTNLKNALIYYTSIDADAVKDFIGTDQRLQDK